jgi:RNA polymerase sigma-70 factor (ECF subfamily)
VEGTIRLLRQPDQPSAPQNEAALVEGCRAFDRQAQEGLYRLYHKRVFSLVLRISGEQDAEELCQEVFLKIFRSIDKFRGESAVGTWIYRLAVNTALSHVTRKPRERSLEEVTWEEPQSGTPTRDPRLRERIERAMAELPAGYRVVLVLHDIDGLSHEEISEILGFRVGTSKSQLHKARQKMRELLGPALGREVRA